MKYRPIFIQLAGGLGNQLFIWQYAHLLESNFGFKVYLIDYYNQDVERKCEIHPIKLNCNHQIKIVKHRYLPDLFRLYDFMYSKNAGSKITKLLSLFIYSCKSSHETPSLDTLRGKLLVRGYFQNYLSVIKTLEYTQSELDRHITSIKSDRSRENDFQIEQVVHVRRGDYVENETTLGVLDDSYFINNLEPNLSYAIHTDETMLGNSELFKNASEVFGKDYSPWLVVAHGSLAKVFLGSNSTLSWWAAVLNKIDDAIIKLPSPWYFSSSYSEEAMHLAKAKYVKAHFRETNK